MAAAPACRRARAPSAGRCDRPSRRYSAPCRDPDLARIAVQIPSFRCAWFWNSRSCIGQNFPCAGGGLRGLGRQQRMRVRLLQRKMPEYETDLVRKALQQQLRRRAPPPCSSGTRNRRTRPASRARAPSPESDRWAPAAPPSVIACGGCGRHERLLDFTRLGARQFNRPYSHTNHGSTGAAAAARTRARSSSASSSALQAVDSVDGLPRRAQSCDPRLRPPPAPPDLPATDVQRHAPRRLLGRSKCRTTRVAIGTVAPDTPM